MADFNLRILESLEDFEAVQDLQRQIWVGSESGIDPAHMLLAVVQHGGVAVGAMEPESGRLIGFVFGFPGLYYTPDGPRAKHCSHILGVHPDYRNSGAGFALKRAQWQLVRHQRLDCITWTYDPLLSRNAHLNITRLGAVCNTYLRDAYGAMSDGLNAGLATDRFQVDWWVNSPRVARRLSKRRRLDLTLGHFLAAGAEILNPTGTDGRGWPVPPAWEMVAARWERAAGDALLLLEIPSDFLALRQAAPELGPLWRQHTRQALEALFQQGYLVTDFVFLRGDEPRSLYVLSHGESTL